MNCQDRTDEETLENPNYLIIIELKYYDPFDNLKRDRLWYLAMCSLIHSIS